jgi:hypothetical protein
LLALFFIFFLQTVSKTQLKVSSATISRTITKLNLTRKKSLKAEEAYTQEKQLQRRYYWNEIKDVEAKNLVFLDETGVNLAMVSLYARARRGQRAYGTRILKRGKNISLIGAMTLNDGFLTGLSFEGGINGDTFVWFIEEILTPKLWSGAVVVMDNLPAHKVRGYPSSVIPGKHLSQG